MLFTNWVVPKFTSEAGDLRANTLMEHLLASKESKNHIVLSSIINGGGDEVLSFELSKKDFIINEVLELENRFVVLGKLENVIKLSFGDEWDFGVVECTRLLKHRGLTLSHWGKHPLM
jgi:hypothetical protein